MTMNHAASKCWLLLCALCIVLPAAKPAVAADPAGEPPPRITIELWLAEIPVDKVRKAGLEVELFRAGETTRLALGDVFASSEHAQRAADLLPGEGLTDLLGVLEKHKLAHIIARPTLTTQNCRHASFETGPIKLEATPSIKEDGRIHLAYYFQLRQPMKTSGSSCTVDLDPGKTALIIPAFSPVTAPLVLLVRASIDKPSNDAEDTNSRKSSSIEVAPRKTPVDGDEPTTVTASPPITVELWVAELSAPALEGMGLDTNNSQLKPDADVSLLEMFQSPKKMSPAVAGNLVQVLDFLKARKVANILAQPKLMTRSGQPASVDVGSLKFDATPTTKDDGRIRVSYKVEISKTVPKLTDTVTGAPGRRTFSNVCTIDDLVPSKAVLVVPAVPWNAFGKPSPAKTPDKMLIVVLRATPAGTAPGDQTTADRKGTYFEVAPTKTR
jgi:hypothetical protein